MTSITGHPSWTDMVEFARLTSHPAVALTVPRHPTILLWRVSAVDPDGTLCAPLIDPRAHYEPFNDQVDAWCYYTGNGHTPPAARCFCGLHAVDHVGALKNIAAMYTARHMQARQGPIAGPGLNRWVRADGRRFHPNPSVTLQPVVHRVECLDAYPFDCGSLDDPKWAPLKTRLFGWNVPFGDVPGTYRARAMRIKPGPVYVTRETPTDVQVRIAERYGVPVHQLDAGDAEGLVDSVAGVLGEPPPPAASTPRLPDGPGCGCGDTHFGGWGAAGVLASAGGRVLLQRRSLTVLEPGTWALPGGALRPGETPVQAAVREFAEEVDFGDVEPRFKIAGTHTSMCAESGWTYTTVLSAYKGEGRPAVKPANSESDMVKWVPVGDVGEYRLHPVFAESWPDLARRLGKMENLPEFLEPPASRPTARPFRVAIVCAGNVCRSPAAEYILAGLLNQAGLPATVTSGGVSTAIGFGADPLTIATLARHGHDATGHRARRVTPGWFDTHDLILAVDTPVANALRRLAPDTAAYAKIRYLREFDPAAKSLEVANPWRGTPAQFEECHGVVEAACRGVAAYVEARARRDRPA